jgi:hypothetical protein
MFAFTYLSAEMLLKVASSLLIKLAGVKASNVFYMYAAVAGVPMLSTVLATPPTVPAGIMLYTHVCAKVTAAIALWPDIKLWLLAFTNVTFGFSAAFMNGYVNVNFAAHDLGADAVGYLSAATVLAAVLSTRVYSLIPQKSLVAFLGSCFFACVAVLAQGDVIELWSLSSWGWGLLVLYALQGFGRGVYESTNKSIFADVFPCERYPGVFANVIMQNSFAFTLCFFLSDYITKQLGWITLTLAILTYPCMLIALHVQRLEDRPSEATAPRLLEEGEGRRERGLSHGEGRLPDGDPCRPVVAVQGSRDHPHPPQVDPQVHPHKRAHHGADHGTEAGKFQAMCDDAAAS